MGLGAMDDGEEQRMMRMMKVVSITSVYVNTPTIKTSVKPQDRRIIWLNNRIDELESKTKTEVEIILLDKFINERTHLEKLNNDGININDAKK